MFKDFISGIKEYKYTEKEARNILKTLPIKVLKNIAEEIIYSDVDIYNKNIKHYQMMYFKNLDRRQKEFFVMERLYKLHR